MKIEKDEITIRDFTETDLPLMFKWLTDKRVLEYNRQTHKANILSGGIRKRNQAAKEIKGFRLFDRVRFKGAVCFVFGRRANGYFDLRRLDGTKVHATASWKQLRLLEHSRSFLTERRMQDDTKSRRSNSSPTYADA